MAVNGPEVAKRIKDTVTALGMSMGDFYNKSGISSALLSQWNTGAQTPSPPKMAAAAKALGKTIEYVAFGKKEKAAASNDDGGVDFDLKQEIINELDGVGLDDLEQILKIIRTFNK